MLVVMSEDHYCFVNVERDWKYTNSEHQLFKYVEAWTT